MKRIIYALLIVLNIGLSYGFFDNPFSVLDVSPLENINIKLNITNKDDIFCLQNGTCFLNSLNVDNLNVSTINTINKTVTNINVTGNIYLGENNLTSDNILVNNDIYIGNDLTTTGTINSGRILSISENANIFTRTRASAGDIIQANNYRMDFGASSQLGDGSAVRFQIDDDTYGTNSLGRLGFRRGTNANDGEFVVETSSAGALIETLKIKDLNSTFAGSINADSLYLSNNAEIGGDLTTTGTITAGKFTDNSSFDSGNRLMQTSGYSDSIDWGNRYLSDGTIEALNWQNRELVSSGGDYILDWSTDGTADFKDTDLTTTGNIEADKLFLPDDTDPYFTSGSSVTKEGIWADETFAVKWIVYNELTSSRSPILTMTRARGDHDTPADTWGGDRLGGFYFGGYGNGDFDLGAAVIGYQDGSISTQVPVKLSFETQSSTVNRRPVVEIDGSGNMDMLISGADFTTKGDINIDYDNYALKLGASQDASIYYTGTNLVINPKVIGSGVVDVAGAVSADNYYGTNTGSRTWTLTTRADDTGHAIIYPTTTLTNANGVLSVCPKGTAVGAIDVYGTDVRSSLSNRERILILAQQGQPHKIYSESAGTGTKQDIEIYASSLGQLHLDTDGSISSTGDFSSTGSISSTLTLADTDSPYIRNAVQGISTGIDSPVAVYLMRGGNFEANVTDAASNVGVRGIASGTDNYGISNNYGGYFSSETSGALTNNGIYVSATGGINNYAIYSANGDNYFAEDIDVQGKTYTNDIRIGDSSVNIEYSEQAISSFEIPILEFSDSMGGTFGGMRDALYVVGETFNPYLLFSNSDGTQTAFLNYDRTNDVLKFSGASGGYTFDYDIALGDNDKIKLGGSQDASIYYDGTDLIINSKEVGSGKVEVLGNLKSDKIIDDDIHSVQEDGIVISSEAQDGGMYYAGDIIMQTTASYGGGDIYIEAQKGGGTGAEGEIYIRTLQDPAYSYIGNDIHIYSEEYGGDAGTLYLQEEAGEIVAGDSSEHPGIKFYLLGDDGGLVASPSVCQFIGGKARTSSGGGSDGGDSIFEATDGGDCNSGDGDGGDGGDIIFNAGTGGTGLGTGVNGNNGRAIFNSDVYIGADDYKLKFGNTDTDLQIYSDGTYGRIDATGGVIINNKLAFTQTDLNEYIDSEADGYMDYGATSRHRFNAPITIEDKTLLVTPVAGTLEFDNDRMYVTNVNTQRAIDRSSDVVTSTTTVTNTATETTVFTADIPANSGKVGNVYMVRAYGDITNAAAADTVTVRYKVGGNTVATVTSGSSKLTDECVKIEATGTLRSVGTNGSYAYQVCLDTGEGCVSECGVATGIDTTVDNDVTITVEWDNAKTGNIFNLYQGYVTYKN